MLRSSRRHGFQQETWTFFFLDRTKADLLSINRAASSNQSPRLPLLQLFFYFPALPSILPTCHNHTRPVRAHLLQRKNLPIRCILVLYPWTAPQFFVAASCLSLSPDFRVLLPRTTRTSSSQSDNHSPRLASALRRFISPRFALRLSRKFGIGTSASSPQFSSS